MSLLIVKYYISIVIGLFGVFVFTLAFTPEYAPYIEPVLLATLSLGAIAGLGLAAYGYFSHQAEASNR